MFFVKKLIQKEKDGNEGGEENTLKTKHALFWMDMEKDSFKHNHTWTEFLLWSFEYCHYTKKIQ